MKDTTDRDQFMRIAMARLKQYYPFYPQRLANAARLYRRHLDNLEK